MCCVQRRRARRGHRRAGTSTVSRAGPSRQLRRWQRHLPSFLPGLRNRSRRSRDSAKPTNLTLRRQSVVRGLRRDGCMGAIGSTARSLATKCQTNLVFPARSVSFASAACGAPRELDRPRDYCLASATGGASRRIAVSCPCEASRAIALVRGDMRSIAPYCQSWPWRSLAASGVLLIRAHTSCSDCLASLRPSE